MKNDSVEGLQMNCYSVHLMKTVHYAFTSLKKWRTYGCASHCIREGGDMASRMIQYSYAIKNGIVL